MACFICLGVVNSCCGELKYANFSEINSNYSLPPARVCVIWNLTIAYGPLKAWSQLAWSHNYKSLV